MALGRLDRQRRCADRRRAAAGAEEPAGRTRRRSAWRRPERCATPKPGSPTAEAAVREHAAAEARGSPGLARRAARRRRGARRAGAGREGRRRAGRPAHGARRERAARIGDDLREANVAFAEARDAARRRRRISATCSARLDTLSAQRSPRDRTALADARAVHEGLKREAEARARRLEAIAPSARPGRSAPRTPRRRSPRSARAASRPRPSVETLAEAPDEIDAKRRALLTQLSEAEALRKDAADRLQEAENRQAELDKAATAAIQALVGVARGARPRRGAADAPPTSAAREVEARIQEALNTPPHLAIRQAGLEPDAPLPDMGEVERQLDRLKVERERLGAVNLRAEEEQTRAVGAAGDDRHRARGHHRGDPQAAPGHPEPQPRGPRAAARRLRGGQRAFPAAVHASVRRRHGRTAADRIRRSAGGRARNPRPPARQEAADDDAAVGRRAGADGDGADLRGVPDQSGADLRARRGRRAARRPQCRALLQSDGRDGAAPPRRASSSSPTTRSPWRA